MTKYVPVRRCVTFRYSALLMILNRRRPLMAKAQDIRKENKKKPAKSIKEKRKEKQEKKKQEK